MGTPDPKLFPAPGTVPNSAGVNPVNQVQAVPLIAQNQATPSLAALSGTAAPVATTTTQPNPTPQVPKWEPPDWYKSFYASYIE